MSHDVTTPAVDRAVIALDEKRFAILRLAQQSNRHPFVIRVGHESEPIRVWPVSFA
jgi:hypothetical protein